MCFLKIIFKFMLLNLQNKQPHLGCNFYLKAIPKKNTYKKL